MKRRSIIVTIFLVINFATFLSAQVQVSEEPLHKTVLINRYFRLLDVWIQPGDTTQFHIHSTPSVFVHFTNSKVATQLKDKNWVENLNIAGGVSYASFEHGPLVHRVKNTDKKMFHVTDIEILAAFDPGTTKKPLQLTLHFENEKLFAYRITRGSRIDGVIKNRGPMLIQLISGNKIEYLNSALKEKKILAAGSFMYIPPGTTFDFLFPGSDDFNLVLFELK